MHRPQTKSQGLGRKSPNSIYAVRRPELRRSKREYCALGSVISSNACIVDLRIGMPNDVPGSFGVFHFIFHYGSRVERLRDQRIFQEGAAKDGF